MAADTRRWGTVRARTTLAATAIVGAAILAGSVAMEALLHRTLVRDLDGVADVRVDDIAALVEAGTLPGVISLEDDGVGQVVDDRGRVVAATTNVGTGAPVSSIRPPGGEPVMRTVADLPGVGGNYRLLALRAESPDGPVTIYVGTNLEPVDDTLDVVRTGLLAGGPALVALVAALTWLMVGRALGPVESIRSQVAHLSSRDLHRRIPVPPTGDEIGRLAATMNTMLDRLQAAADKQHRFVADASHELQTPLAAARTDLEVALAHPDATAWPATARDLLERNGQMERLVADLLFVARSDAATAPRPAPSPVDLHEIVLEEATRLRTAHRVQVDTTGVASAFVLGRSDDLGRAVRNLLDNAERYATSTVRIGLRNGGGTVTLTVDDDGPGVAPEHRDLIFERFTRLDHARSRRTGGTGLGLAIVKEIVTRHDGAVAVQDGPHGARFVMTLPSD